MSPVTWNGARAVDRLAGVTCPCTAHSAASPTSICTVAWPIPKSWSSRCCRSVRNASPGWPPGITRCAVSAFSVVLIGQMWRSCTRATPGSAASSAATFAGSIPGGTAFSAMPSESRNSPQVPPRITATITRLTTGSIHAARSTGSASPATTTPADTSASTAMCRKAPRTLRSPCRPRRTAARSRR